MPLVIVFLLSLLIPSAQLFPTAHPRAIPASPHSIMLVWNPVLSDANWNITGYYWYRSTTPNGPFNLRNPNNQVTGTTVTDTKNILTGHTYCYVVAAVGVSTADGSTAVSPYSDSVCATV